MSTVTRRFIAGAVCPRCGAMDTIVVDSSTDCRECVECGFSDQRPDDAVTTRVEPPTRVTRPAARRAETPSEPVRLVEPGKGSGDKR